MRVDRRQTRFIEGPIILPRSASPYDASGRLPFGRTELATISFTLPLPAPVDPHRLNAYLVIDKRIALLLSVRGDAEHLPD